LVALVAEQPSDEGKTYGEVLEQWFDDRPLASDLRELKLIEANGEVLKREADIGLVISSSPFDAGKEVGLRLASTGMPVVSESPGLRGVSDIPLVVPEINSDHLSIIDSQKSQHGWDTGYIVSNPVCTITILALSLKPIVDAFGVENVIVTTLQAVSGAGRYGVASLDIIDNILPYIKREEEKVTSEGRKIFGHVKGGEILPANFALSATCTRVPVLHGHTGAVFVQCSNPVSIEDVIEVFINFQGLPSEFQLPSAPRKPLIFTGVQGRPQPRLDRYSGEGRSVTVGRLRLDEAFNNGIKYVVVGHNKIRGTAGNTLMNAELLFRKGLLD
jgi:aspartate-semialdehyde dehydrogenase